MVALDRLTAEHYGLPIEAKTGTLLKLAWLIFPDIF